MPEVLTDLCEKIDTQKFSEKNFLICGGGGSVVPRSQAAEQSTADEMNYILICFCVIGTAQKKVYLMYNSSEYIN